MHITGTLYSSKLTLVLHSYAEEQKFSWLANDLFFKHDLQSLRKTDYFVLNIKYTLYRLLFFLRAGMITHKFKMSVIISLTLVIKIIPQIRLLCGINSLHTAFFPSHEGILIKALKYLFHNCNWLLQTFQKSKA